MPELPTGTVTFLFTDIEGSTRLVSTLGARYADLLADHHRLLRAVFARRDGMEVAMEGDSFFVVFRSALSGIRAAADAQQALAAHPWPDDGHVRVRMGLHTGQAVLVGDTYVGIDINRAARISAASNGGQVLVSDAARGVVGSDLPDGLTLRDLGRHRLKDVGVEHLWQLDIEGLETHFASLRSLEAHPSNLPVESREMVDRERERAELEALVGSARLVTVTGPGGIGKSVLAKGVAAGVLSEFPDGIGYLDLAPIDDVDVLAAELASALGLRLDSTRQPIQDLVDQLRGREVLLVLDTADRLQGLSSAVGRLLSGCPRIRILATSRAPLHVAGEREFPISSLPPDAALALFVDRARGVRPDFAITDANQVAVAAICERLDGLPLAIELAAARVKLLTPQAILDRLARRLPFLSGGSRDAPERQQTLSATIAWSYESLDSPEQAMLQRLAVFASGFDLEAVEAVGVGDDAEGMDALATLERLVDQSLVATYELDGLSRFRLLGTIGEFALDRLVASGEAERVRDAHSRYWLGVAHELAPKLEGPEEVEVVAYLQRDFDEYRAALEWSLAAGSSPERAALGLEMAGTLGRYWYEHGQIHEGSAWLERALDSGAEAAPALRAAAAYWAGVMGEESRASDRANARLEEALTIQRDLGDTKGAARTLNSLGVVARSVGDLARAEDLLRQSLEQKRALGDQHGIATTLSNLGVVAIHRGKLDEGRAYLEETLALDLKAEIPAGIATSRVNLAAVLVRTGLVSEARDMVRAALPVFAELGDPDGVAECLERLVEIAAASGDSVGAARFLAAATTIREREGVPLRDIDRVEVDQAAAAASATLDPAVLEQARSEGAAMDVDAAVAYVLQEVSG